MMRVCLLPESMSLQVSTSWLTSCVVLITLRSVNPTMNLGLPDRRVCLSNNDYIRYVGRSSKRNKAYEPAENNCWFDSPVMSRDHAKLEVDFEKQVSSTIVR